MTTTTVARAAAILLAALCIPAWGQAPPAAPASPPGKGPIPARMYGKPNWSGFWVPPGGMMEVYRGPSGLEGAPPGLNAKAFLDPTMPPLKSPYKEMQEKAVKAMDDGPLPSKIALCFPPGMPGMMGMIYGMEILQTPNIISITSEWQAASRRIWLDLKEHPPADELDDTYVGHSIAHWEGDVLVVDTVGIRPDVPIDLSTNLPHSNKLRIVERWTQTAPDRLVNEMTITDPDVFGDKKWNKKFTYKHRPDLRLGEYVCLDNNRNIDEEGRQKF